MYILASIRFLILARACRGTASRRDPPSPLTTEKSLVVRITNAANARARQPWEKINAKGKKKLPELWIKAGTAALGAASSTATFDVSWSSSQATPTPTTVAAAELLLEAKSGCTYLTASNWPIEV